MNWSALESTEQLDEIQQASKENVVLIFKHSTRCSISRAALDRFERNWSVEDLKNVKPYYLDLIANRTVSNQVAQVFNVDHESPQVLIIKDGKSVYDRSHLEIDYKSIKSFISKEG